jgi:hypothetical protein
VPAYFKARPGDGPAFRSSVPEVRPFWVRLQRRLQVLLGRFGGERPRSVGAWITGPSSPWIPVRGSLLWATSGLGDLRSLKTPEWMEVYQKRQQTRPISRVSGHPRARPAHRMRPSYFPGSPGEGRFQFLSLRQLSIVQPIHLNSFAAARGPFCHPKRLPGLIPEPGGRTAVLTACRFILLAAWQQAQRAALADSTSPL